MPVYCYSTEEGEVHELVFPRGEAPERVELPNGEIALRDYRAEGVTGFVSKTSTPTSGWPMKPCCASGVHASQAGELRDHLARRGCRTEISPDGDPIYTSAAHRKKALKIRGLQDRN